ncbi:MAG TPA: twin-arginine translocase TatA/TatE family subunit [Gammaproteobacteria bacterium]|jgi:sec-independent protein translocase protein TatA
MEFGFGKLLLLLVMVMLVFGTAKLPKIGEDLGKAVRSFKKASQEGVGEVVAKPDLSH